jgi:hypothetical protein
LQDEIAQVRQANRLCWHGGKKTIPGVAGDQQRRLQGGQKILDELLALTDWKKQ